MISNILLAILVFLGNPEITLQVDRNDYNIISLEVIGKDQIVHQCLDNGQEIRYRFEIKICNRNSFWPDCSKEMVQTHFLSWTPITNSYQLIRDRHRDQQLPEGITFEEREVALATLRKIINFDLKHFGIDSLDTDLYISTRAFSECRGQYSQTLAELSYYLTFGLLRLSGFNTGWTNFEIPKR